MMYSGQLCQNLKGAAFYCSGRWVSATARYEVSITNATSSWEQRERELLCIRCIRESRAIRCCHGQGWMLNARVGCVARVFIT